MEERYLFKAKRTDNGEWVKGALVYDGRDKLYRIITEINYSTGTCLTTDNAPRVDKSTICQCTGLKDRNGNLIWENDIIECKNRKHNFQTQIEWDAYCAGFIFQDTETSAVGLDAITANGLYSESKVIGNIFDNPELLESEE
jgi:uncharacterized phage protein (TIGR01671 family)